ncbi:MAG: DUF5694 domain-containing protein [Gemmatimonadaceae bacterium]
MGGLTRTTARAQAALPPGPADDPETAAYGPPYHGATHTRSDPAICTRSPRRSADTTDVGADVASDWHARNLRIVANIARIAQPGDGVLVLFGSGPRPLLDKYLRESGLFEVAEVADN